jgi:hypothetical protein
MKTMCVVVALALASCSADAPRPGSLDTGQATDLAQKLANDKAEALYRCRPFSNGPPAQLLQNAWVWHDREGQGQLDLEATVRFSTNGANPSVSVQLLDSRPGFLQFRR